MEAEIEKGFIILILRAGRIVGSVAGERSLLTLAYPNPNHTIKLTTNFYFLFYFYYTRPQKTTNYDVDNRITTPLRQTNLPPKLEELNESTNVFYVYTFL